MFFSSFTGAGATRNDPPNLLPNFAPPKSPLVFPRQRHHSQGISALPWISWTKSPPAVQWNATSGAPHQTVGRSREWCFFGLSEVQKTFFLGESEGELFLFCWFLFWQIIAKKIERKEQKVRTMKNDSERMTKMFWKSSQRNNDLNLTSRNPRNSDLEFEKEYNLKYPAKKKILEIENWSYIKSSLNFNIPKNNFNFVYQLSEVISNVLEQEWIQK